MAKLFCDVCETELPDGTGSKGGDVRCSGCKTSKGYWNDRPVEDIREHGEKLGRWKLRNEWNLSRKAARVRASARNRVAQTKQKVRESLGATRH